MSNRLISGTELFICKVRFGQWTEPKLFGHLVDPKLTTVVIFFRKKLTTIVHKGDSMEEETSFQCA